MIGNKKYKLLFLFIFLFNTNNHFFSITINAFDSFKEDQERKDFLLKYSKFLLQNIVLLGYFNKFRDHMHIYEERAKLIAKNKKKISILNDGTNTEDISYTRDFSTSMDKYFFNEIYSNVFQEFCLNFQKKISTINDINTSKIVEILNNKEGIQDLKQIFFHKGDFYYCANGNYRQLTILIDEKNDIQSLYMENRKILKNMKKVFETLTIKTKFPFNMFNLNGNDYISVEELLNKFTIFNNNFFSYNNFKIENIIVEENKNILSKIIVNNNEKIADEKLLEKIKESINQLLDKDGEELKKKVDVFVDYWSALNPVNQNYFEIIVNPEDFLNFQINQNVINKMYKDREKIFKSIYDIYENEIIEQEDNHEISIWITIVYLGGMLILFPLLIFTNFFGLLKNNNKYYDINNKKHYVQNSLENKFENKITPKGNTTANDDDLYREMLKNSKKKSKKKSIKNFFRNSIKFITDKI